MKYVPKFVQKANKFLRDEEAAQFSNETLEEEYTSVRCKVVCATYDKNGDVQGFVFPEKKDIPIGNIYYVAKDKKEAASLVDKIIGQSVILLNPGKIRNHNLYRVFGGFLL